jgi:ABC-type Mn2+/Zn2+ transport system ATPase subunit
MAGLRSASEGTVLHDGSPVIAAGASAGHVGFVPQDDIIHQDLALRRTLRYAARLRLPAGTPAAEADRIVDGTLRDLDLVDRAGVRVSDLSGGQRKRASIAVELLTQPHLFFLDEPTSGLDPSTSAEVLAVLRRLTDRGVTVVLTTHNPADIEACDRVVFLARNGYLAFDGIPDEAKAYFEVDQLPRVYGAIASQSGPPAWSHRVADPPVLSTAPTTEPHETVRPFRQWLLLSRRSADVMARNRLTLAVLIGSPVLVTAMMTVLFRAGAFDARGPNALGPTQMVFWIAFSGFFFGITYGLLQIVGEMAVFRRERFAGLSVGAYVLSKMAVLIPVLALVGGVLLGALGALHRLPSLDWQTYAALFFSLLIESVAALALGLLASAAVADPAQATLALPMLCFPQVLFAGAIVPVAQMPMAGQIISAGMANRWAFEALGRVLPLHTDSGAAGVAAYSGAFSGSPLMGWLVLAGTAVMLTGATVAVLRRRH